MVAELWMSAAIASIGIMLIIMLHVCILRRCGAGTSRNRMINITGAVPINQDSSTTGTECASMSIDDLKKLPCFQYKEEDPNKECAVCLEGFKIGEVCRLLPICNHSFHVQCIDSWLQQTPSCPVCRTSADSI
ncbi:RING-H2 finger protein ATL10-like [Coffea eugenioides]|uniref:RING-H2 finger protein ATL10-like n=1 Tax=Coffea eugenioides TaxID=49369 RepID=UPI000F611388|nr:RING-H2 finger protein ATL10-like [Coffea eugenioides]